MSNGQDVEKNENEQETTNELTSEELDQVVAGTGADKPKPSAPKQEYLVIKMETILISSVSGE